MSQAPVKLNTSKTALFTLTVTGLALIATTAIWLGMWDHQRVTYYFWIFNFQSVLFLIAAGVVINYEPDRRALYLVLAVAFILRVMLLPTEPAHSTDIFRYVWEGYVQTHGINPFRYVPAADQLAHLRDTYVYPNINRKEYVRTPYPPVAQIIFAISNLIRPLGVTTLKVIWVSLEGVTIWSLIRLLEHLKMNPARVIVYAWCPLSIWEISQNGHLDAGPATFIALAGLAAARRRSATTGVLIALATMVKLFPGILAAALWRKWDRRLIIGMASTLILFYLPYLGVGKDILGFVTHYPSEEGFFSGERYLLLKWIHMVIPLPPLVYLGGFIALLGIVTARLMFKGEKTIEEQLRGCTLLAGLILFFISPQYGWYYLWLLPFLCVTIERVSLLQVVSVMTVIAGYLRYHAARVITPDMAVAPITIVASLRQRPTIQWLWLVMIASAAWLSWI